MISTKILWAFIIFCDILTQFCCCHQIGGFSVNLIVNKKASGEITEALTAESLLQCAQRCLRRKKCNAINYANLMTDEANCELQRVTFGEEKFEHSKEWGYSYLFYLETTGTKEEVPVKVTPTTTSTMATSKPKQKEDKQKRLWQQLWEKFRKTIFG